MEIPPDPIGAAGPDHLVSVVNSSIEVFARDGTLLSSRSLKQFFSIGSDPPPQTVTFDPKLLYDQHQRRFVVVSLERVEGDGNPHPGNLSRIFLAVSATSDPTGDWHYHVINAKETIDGVEYWADYPGLAINADTIYITANMFSFPPAVPESSIVRLWTVDKGVDSDLYAGGPAQAAVHNPYAFAGSSVTTQPAHIFGAAPPGVGTFLVGYQGLTLGGAGSSEGVQVVRVSPGVVSPTFQVQVVPVGDIEDLGGSFGFPSLPDAPQKDTSHLVEVNDRRALHAVWRENQLYLTATIVPNSGPDTGQTTAHWWVLDTTNPDAITLSDQGNAGGEEIAPGTYTFFPAVAVDPDGNMGIGFSASAPTAYPGAYYAGRLASDPPGTLRPTGVLREGLDFYYRPLDGPRNRWGDYSGISLDPVNQSTFWVFNQYALERGTVIPDLPDQDGRWGTAFGNFALLKVHAITGNVTLQMRTNHSDTAVTAATGGFEATVPVNVDGTFEVQDLASGTYTLTASAAGYLSAQMSELVLEDGGTSEVALPPVELRAGDVDGSGFVNINDITAVVASFAKTVTDCQDSAGRYVDLNCSGTVNINDITGTVSNFGKGSPQPWPLG